MVFGWPGSLRIAPLFRPHEVGPGDLNWLLEVLFARLALRPAQISRREPSPVVMQIGRLLCLMMRERYVDPLYLTYLAQRHSIDHDAVYSILEDQWEAFEGSVAVADQR